MKCYEMRDNWQFKRGISIGLSGALPQLRIPPFADTTPPLEENVYKTDLELPVLDEQLAASVRAQTSDQAFRHPDVRLLACDLEQRAQFWAQPETEETKNDALLLAVWLSAHPHLAVMQLEGPFTILAEAPAYRGHKDYRGLAKLIRLSEGAQIRLCNHARIPRKLGFRPKVQTTLVCRAGGELKRLWDKKELEAQ
jgi:hypothetical protein